MGYPRCPDAGRCCRTLCPEVHSLALLLERAVQASALNVDGVHILPPHLAPDLMHVLCRSLVEVTREQAVFEFHDEEGLLIGFYSPPFVVSSNIGAP